jgi:serine/threonine protein phosphatase PrpC
MLLARLRREGNRQDGAAAVTALVAGRHLYVADCGDCRCVLVRGFFVVWWLGALAARGLARRGLLSLVCLRAITTAFNRPNPPTHPPTHANATTNAPINQQGTQGEDGRIVATRLSVDHKPNLPEEKLRVQRAGGSVEFSGVWRVAHQAIPMRLAVSRALGDPAFKRRGERTRAFSAGRAWLVGEDGTMTTRRAGGGAEQEAEDEAEGEGEAGAEPLVSPVPYVHCRDLGPDDLVLVLCSDGVFDALTDEEAVRMSVEAIRRHPSHHPPTAHPLRRGPFRPNEMGVKEAADLLVNTALMRGSYDNCTAAVIALQQQQLQQQQQSVPVPPQQPRPKQQ